MKLEFIDDIGQGGRYIHVVSGRLVRLYDFDQTEAKRFQNAIRELIQSQKEVRLGSLDFVQEVNCTLALKLSPTDVGIQMLNESNFECFLTLSTYEEMVHIIQPFVNEDSNGYQWLPNGDAEIDFLFSPGGTW